MDSLFGRERRRIECRFVRVVVRGDGVGEAVVSLFVRVVVWTVRLSGSEESFLLRLSRFRTRDGCIAADGATE